MHIHGVKKVGCRHSMYRMNSNSNEIARFRKLDCCSELSYDTLLVYCTPRMTELEAVRVYTATLCTRL